MTGSRRWPRRTATWNKWFPPHPTETLVIVPSGTPAAEPTSTAPAPAPVAPTETPAEAPPSAPALGPGATWVRPADGAVMVSSDVECP